MSNDSVIGALKLELKIQSGLEAEQARAKVDAIADEKIIDVIERVEKDYAGVEINLDTMEIDLGRVSEEDLPRALEAELRSRLDQFSGKSLLGFLPDDDIFSIEIPGMHGSSFSATSHSSIWAKLTGYLSEPELPWDAAKDFNPADIVVLLAENILEESGAEGIESQFSTLDDRQLARMTEIAEARIASLEVLQLYLERTGSVLEADSAEVAALKEMSTLKEVTTAVRNIISSRDSGESTLAKRAKLWSRYLSSHITAEEEGVTEAADGSENVIAAESAAESGMAPVSGWNENEGAALENTEDGEDSALLISGDKAQNSSVPGPGTTEQKAGASTDVSIEAEERILEDRQESVNGEAINPKESREDITVAQTAIEKGGTVSDMTEHKTAEPIDAAELAHEDRQAATHGEAKEDRTASDIIEHKTTESIDAAEQMLEDRQEAAHAVQGSEDLEDAWETEEEEAQILDKRLLISDAGLVLIHPFISRFLQNMKLVDRKGKFISAETRIHAVHLLRHLTRLEGEHHEHCLILEKILCGLPVGYAIPTEWKASERDEEEIEDLLKSVLSYWASLSKSSTGALCSGFLQRPGSVEKEDGMYIIRVEGSAMDILLDDLPWGLSMIMLPWLEQPIIVEWQR